MKNSLSSISPNRLIETDLERVVADLRYFATSESADEDEDEDQQAYAFVEHLLGERDTRKPVSWPRLLECIERWRRRTLERGYLFMPALEKSADTGHSASEQQLLVEFDQHLQSLIASIISSQHLQSEICENKKRW